MEISWGLARCDKVEVLVKRAGKVISEDAALAAMETQDTGDPWQWDVCLGKLEGVR